MRRKLGIAALVLACAALAATSAQAKRDATVKLQFFTYAWQPPTVQATKDLVGAWNKAHPDIQVELVQGDPNSVHDKLLTSFVGGAAPDIIHDEAADIAGFTGQGYLADLTKLIPAGLKAEIPQDIWDTVTFNGKVTGVPSLLQTYNVFVNVPVLKQAGIALPTIAKPWTWFEFRQNAKKLTGNGKYGVCWGLRSPTSAFLSLSLNFNGKFFYTAGGKTEVRFGAPEQQVPRRVHDMIYADKSVDPVSVGQSGSAVLPSFFAGSCGMTVQGSFQAQGMVNQAPASFNWAMLPPLKGSSQNQAANPQTLSIAQQSSHKKEAMQFIAFFYNAKNMAKLAAGDWLIPSAPKAGPVILATAGHKGSWRVALASIKNLKLAPFQKLEAYPRWKDQIATPSLREYLGDKITLDDLGKKLVDGWTTVGGH